MLKSTCVYFPPGNGLYTIVAHYFGAPSDIPGSFRSNEDLQLCEPYLRETIAGLRIPIPVLVTDVQEVIALAEVPVFRLYGVGSDPIATIAAGQTSLVTGKSPNRLWWRIVCPEGKEGTCWISADPTLTQPK
jgi:hypothetical protein